MAAFEPIPGKPWRQVAWKTVGRDEKAELDTARERVRPPPPRRGGPVDATLRFISDNRGLVLEQLRDPE